MSQTNGSAILKDAAPFSPEKTEEIVEQFHRDGFYFIGPVLTSDEVNGLKDAMVRRYEDEDLRDDERAITSAASAFCACLNVIRTSKIWSSENHSPASRKPSSVMTAI